MTDVCSHGRPDHQEQIRELREAVGLFAGAMPITPKAAWEEAIAEARDLRVAVAAANQRAEQAEAILAKLDGDDDMLCGELARMLIGVGKRYPADLISVTVWDEAGRVVQWLRALVADQPDPDHRRHQ